LNGYLPRLTAQLAQAGSDRREVVRDPTTLAFLAHGASCSPNMNNERCNLPLKLSMISRAGGSLSGGCSAMTFKAMSSNIQRTS
jgi:hypothetical protein